ncbi:16626_t:CDS:2, partial [Racocetra fulgida]
MWSGILIFGLQLESVIRARNAKNRELKSIENCGNSTILKRAKNFGNQALELLKSASQNYYSKEDCIKGYRQIAAVNSTIPYKGAISNERILLNKQMEANIKITQVKLNYLEVEKVSMDTGFEFGQEMIDIARIGAQRSIKDLLNYIISYLEQNNILKCTDPVVHLRILGNGRNVDHKIKHTMLIIAELKARGLYNDKSRKIIVDKIKRINVTFQFWENHESYNWNYTLLMGKNKLKVLQSFNFGVLFRP